MDTMKGSLTVRVTHLAMVALTFVNGLWVDASACACSISRSCAASAVGCCGDATDDGACECCCKSKAKTGEAKKSGCPHCAATSDQTGSSQCELKNSRVA